MHRKHSISSQGGRARVLCFVFTSVIRHAARTKTGICTPPTCGERLVALWYLLNPVEHLEPEDAVGGIAIFLYLLCVHEPG